MAVQCSVLNGLLGKQVRGAYQHTYYTSNGSIARRAKELVGAWGNVFTQSTLAILSIQHSKLFPSWLTGSTGNLTPFLDNTPNAVEHLALIVIGVRVDQPSFQT